MEYPRIALKVGPKAFSKLITIGIRVAASLTGNLIYNSPNPSIAVLETAITDVSAAQGIWGTKGSRGSHNDYVDLCTKALTLQLTIKQMAQYVTNIASQQAGANYVLMQNLMSTSGFELAKTKSAQGPLEAVRNFRNPSDRSLAWNSTKLKWTRPLNTSSLEDVNIYELLRSETPDFSTAVKIASVTKGEFIDTNTTGTVVTWNYWVVAYNAAGAGSPSAMLAVTILSM